ncbi:Trigger factor [Dissostichus eleginoides]|uniref:Trigger factor n=1 Tax=Dissostichus eleginoides TaxID=100907 RepID=A0AAD9ETT7_DISEL|nr:Trigger factor [Dissostichus eleginoides]
MMEGERVGIRQGSEGKVKILRNEKEKNGSQKRNAAEITVKAREWRRKNVRWTSTPTSLPLANANGSDLRDRWSGPPGEEGQLW